MAHGVLMPALSPTMDAGTIARWMVKEGAHVAVGDILAEIETDKATMEIESEEEGIVAKILFQEGAEDVPVGEVIALIGREGEGVESIESNPLRSQSVSVSNDAKEKQIVGRHFFEKPIDDAERVRISPLARRLARDNELDPASLSGSGPNGRIVRRDIEAKLVTANANLQTPGPQTPTNTKRDLRVNVDARSDQPYREEKLSAMRRTIARRLTESKQTIPHFYLRIDVELDSLLEQRKEFNSCLVVEDLKISVNDYIIKAAALALRDVPEANVQYTEEAVRYHQEADISVAVAVEGGLVTPVVRGACKKGLTSIASTMQDLALRARSKSLSPEEYKGGSFSISNLGMYGVQEFSAIINPPQSAILAIGQCGQRPVVKDGAVGIASIMTCTISCDHRVIDGAVAAKFLAAFKGFLEDPMTMLL